VIALGLRRIVGAMLLATAMALFSPGAIAEQASAHHHDASGTPVVFGLTAGQLGMAALVGAALGATGAVVAGRLGVGAGIGLLGVVYVAHLGVEALIVSGVYMMWRSKHPPEEPEVEVIPTVADFTRVSGLGLAPSSRLAAR
jgi:hypothetical protein